VDIYFREWYGWKMGGGGELQDRDISWDSVGVVHCEIM